MMGGNRCILVFTLVSRLKAGYRSYPRRFERFALISAAEHQWPLGVAFARSSINLESQTTANRYLYLTCFSDEIDVNFNDT